MELGFASYQEPERVQLAMELIEKSIVYRSGYLTALHALKLERGKLNRLLLKNEYAVFEE